MKDTRPSREAGLASARRAVAAEGRGSTPRPDEPGDIVSVDDLRRRIEQEVQSGDSDDYHLFVVVDYFVSAIAEGHEIGSAEWESAATRARKHAMAWVREEDDRRSFALEYARNTTGA